jgi:hypothetical protein
MKNRYFQILAEIDEISEEMNAEGLPDYEAQELFEQIEDLNNELKQLEL